MHLNSDAAIQSLNVNLGRLSFSSENEVEVETIVELKANTTSKDLLYIQKGNSLEIKSPKKLLLELATVLCGLLVSN